MTSPISTKPGVWDARTHGPIIHDNLYYTKCFFGGILACGLTHMAVTPLDVAKCSIQVSPEKYKSLSQAMKLISAEEGTASLFKGWVPTLAGYSAQGMFKFGLYEYFKDAYSNMAGEENSVKYRGSIYLLGSASAEVVADVALCPFEMTKVKVQTSAKGTWPTAFIPAISQMNQMKSETRFPFGSLVPLWSRQIPYTMAKFFFFEKTVEAFYTHVFTKPRDSYAKSTQLGVTFASGYLAGVICAIVSHPADNIVSLMSKPSNKSKSAGEIAREVGPFKLFTSGLGIRILMIGTLTGLQWYIYDQFKTIMGMGTSGGTVVKR